MSDVQNQDDARRILWDILNRLSCSPGRFADSNGIYRATLSLFLGNPKRGSLGSKNIGVDVALRINAGLARHGIDKEERQRFLSALHTRTVVTADSDMTTADDTTGAILRAEPPSEVNNKQLTTSLSRQDLLREASRLQSGGQHRKAEQAALEARSASPYGSEEWADITLRYLAEYRRQVGDFFGSDAYISAVEHLYRERDTQPSPCIQALLSNRRGRLLIQQQGRFQDAGKLFENALSQATEAHDLPLQLEASHFIVRALTEQALAMTGTWLRAKPTSRALPPLLAQKLVESVNRDAALTRRYDPSNVHHYNRVFIASALLKQRNALSELVRKQGLFVERDMGHLVDLAQARCDLSDGEWDSAIGHALDARFGFYDKHSASNMAYAISIEAGARRREGLRTERDVFDVMDLWVFVMLVHPYPSHPLFQIAQNNFMGLWQQYINEHPYWIHNYRTNLSYRVQEREGVFRAANYLKTDLLPLMSLTQLTDKLAPVFTLSHR